MRYSPLMTDLYEMTMLAGYLEEGMSEKPAVFDLFFRTNPFEGATPFLPGWNRPLSIWKSSIFFRKSWSTCRILEYSKPALSSSCANFVFAER